MYQFVEKTKKKCKQCGTEFMGNSIKLFCDESCRIKYHYTAKKVSGQCLLCGASFEGRTTKKYCSDRCGRRHWKQKQTGRVSKPREPRNYNSRAEKDVRPSYRFGMIGKRLSTDKKMIRWAF